MGFINMHHSQICAPRLKVHRNVFQYVHSMPKFTNLCSQIESSWKCLSIRTQHDKVHKFVLPDGKNEESYRHASSHLIIMAMLQQNCVPESYMHHLLLNWQGRGSLQHCHWSAGVWRWRVFLSWSNISSSGSFNTLTLMKTGQPPPR